MRDTILTLEDQRQALLLLTAYFSFKGQSENGCPFLFLKELKELENYHTGSIDFFGVHPLYCKCGIAKLFLDKVMNELLVDKDISVTTFREGDKADTGYRKYNIKIVSELGENEYSAVNVADTLLSILEEYKQKNIDIFDIKVNRGTLEQHFINLSRGV